MASFDYHAPTDRYHIRFRWDKPYKRSLQFPDENSARRRSRVIEEFIQDLKLGKRTIPEGVDAADFILAAGSNLAKPLPVAEAVKVVRTTLGDLWKLYDERSAGRSKESTTRETEGYHQAHLLRVLGEDYPLDKLDLSAVQDYARKRAREE